MHFGQIATLLAVPTTRYWVQRVDFGRRGGFQPATTKLQAKPTRDRHHPLFRACAAARGTVANAFSGEELFSDRVRVSERSQKMLHRSGARQDPRGKVAVQSMRMGKGAEEELRKGNEVADWTPGRRSRSKLESCIRCCSRRDRRWIGQRGWTGGAVVSMSAFWPTAVNIFAKRNPLPRGCLDHVALEKQG